MTENIFKSYRIIDPDTGKWWNGSLYTPEFGNKPHSWKSESIVKQKCEDYFVNWFAGQQNYISSPHTIEIIEYEVVERVKQKSGPLHITSDYVKKLAAFDKAIAPTGYGAYARCREFMAETLRKKPMFRYYVYLDQGNLKRLTEIIAKSRIRLAGKRAALMDDVDLIAAKMLVNFDIIYDIEDGKFIYKNPNIC